MGTDFSDYYRHQAEMEETALNQRNMEVINANNGLGSYAQAARIPSYTYTPPQNGFALPAAGSPNIFTWIGLAVIAVVVTFGVILFQEMRREIDTGQWSSAPANARLAAGANRNVTLAIERKSVAVDLYRKSGRVWAAVGDYRGVDIKTEGRNPTAAVRHWRKAAERVLKLHWAGSGHVARRRFTPASQDTNNIEANGAPEAEAHAAP